MFVWEGMEYTPCWAGASCWRRVGLSRWDKPLPHQMGLVAIVLVAAAAKQQADENANQLPHC